MYIEYYTSPMDGMELVVSTHFKTYESNWINRGGLSSKINWLVVSTHLKIISQNGNLPQIGMKLKNI